MTGACECSCHENEDVEETSVCIHLGAIVSETEFGKITGCFACIQKKVFQRYFEEWSRP